MSPHQVLKEQGAAHRAAPTTTPEPDTEPATLFDPPGTPTQTSPPHSGKPALTVVKDPAPDSKRAAKPTPRTRNQQAQALARTHREHEPLSNFPAVLAVAKRAPEGGHNYDAVEAALIRLAETGWTVSNDTLRIELKGKGGYRPYQNPPNAEYDAAMWPAEQPRDDSAYYEPFYPEEPAS